MATLISSSGSSGSNRATPFRVSTREVSLDFSVVGPDQSPGELGGFSETAFRELVEKFAAIPTVKLLDGDPQLIVSAKRGRYVIIPSTGKLLLRPANDSQQPYVKFDPVDVPPFLDSNDQTVPGQAPAKNFQTLIGSAANMVAAAEAATPETPTVPIYGAFPQSVGRFVSNAPFTPDTPPPTPPAPIRTLSRKFVISVSAVFVLVAAASFWGYYGPGPADKPLPPAPPSEFTLVASPELIASLKKRFAATYATAGTDGERLLELRADGTFRYQEFGTNVARTNSRNGTYVFAVRHGTKTPLIRASGLGTIDLLDEKKLFCQRAVFNRLP